MKKVIKSVTDALNKKYQQRIELLSNNELFITDIREARLKLKMLIKKYDDAFEHLLSFLTDGLKKNERIEVLRKNFHVLDAEVIKLRAEKELVDRSIDIAKKFGLYPADEWSNLVISLILEDEKYYDTIYDPLVTFNPWFKSASKHGFGVLQNCDVKLRINPMTNERELLLRIYPDTALDDIRKSWAYVKKIQLVLKKEYGTKQWYPLKNLGLAKKVMEVDKKLGIRKCASDWDKQNEIFGETDNFKKEDGGINKIKQTRHRYKKRFGLKS